MHLTGLRAVRLAVPGAPLPGPVTTEGSRGPAKGSTSVSKGTAARAGCRLLVYPATAAAGLAPALEDADPKR